MGVFFGRNFLGGFFGRNSLFTLLKSAKNMEGIDLFVKILVFFKTSSQGRRKEGGGRNFNP